MNINQFIAINNIRPADAIIMRKKFFDMVDHYVIYVGVFGNRHRFVANYTKGIKDISPQELTKFLEYLDPTKVDRFPGQERGRSQAVQRAISRVGENAYNVLTNNCEHFKNWVHYGKSHSKQAENFTNGLSVVAGIGFIAMAFGLISKRE